MYAKEMKDTQGRRKGSGDAPVSSNSETVPRDRTPSTGGTDEFLFGYGNYGNPHSFAPYQLILLLIDFIFNWSMDLTHEYPLAVLVIFVFQSLAIIINLILYIMAAANQAMQVGLHRRVTIHHWLNLIVCLLYISLTGWWFIWALRKSWPSVSDQFSFTWPSAGLQPLMNSTAALPIKNASISTRRLISPRSLAGGGNGGGAAAAAPPPLPLNTEIIKEHYSLWSNGFNAVYVCHRTVAILYYFIYLRATFVVLNTPEMDRFAEKKKSLVENFWEARKKAEREGNRSKSSRRKRGVLTSAYSEDGEGLPHHPPFSLGLQDYLAESSKFLMESEALRQGGQTKLEDDDGGRRVPPAVKSSKSKRQILWADDNNGKISRRDDEDKEEDKTQTGRHYDDDDDDDKGSMEPELITVRKHKPPPKPRRRQSRDFDAAEEETESTVTRYQAPDSDEESAAEVYNQGGRQPRQVKEQITRVRAAKHQRDQRRSSRDELQENE